MSPLPTLPGVYYCIVRGTADARPISNIFVFQTDTPPSTPAADAALSSDVATAVAAHWPGVAADLHVSYTGVEVACYPLGHPTLPAFLSSFTGNGVIAGATGLKQVAALVHHTVYRRGKGSQSRTFLSPLSINSLDSTGEQLTSSEHGNLQTDFGTFITGVLAALNALSAGFFTYVQLSKKGAGTTYPIVNSTVDILVASQDRRLGR